MKVFTITLQKNSLFDVEMISIQLTARIVIPIRRWMEINKNLLLGSHTSSNSQPQ